MSTSRNVYTFSISHFYESLNLLFSWKEYAYELYRTPDTNSNRGKWRHSPKYGAWGVSMSSISPNLEICIHFLYSVTIYNDSSFYFFEIVVLISWAGTPTQIRMRVGSVTFHATGPLWRHIVFCMSKSWNIYMYTLFSYYLQRLSLLFPWSEYSYHFGGYPDRNKNEAGLHHISWYTAKECQYAFRMSKSRIFIHFQPLIIVLGFSASSFLEMVMPVR